MLDRRPRLEDVARLSGVSTATVSRVLNTPDLVRAATRERVQAAVVELGYTPHFGGRALASDRTDTIGAVIPTMENAIFARGLQALQETLADAGKTLLVATSNYDSEREHAQIRALLGRGVDGLALIGEARDAQVYDMLERSRVPFVLMWAWRPDSPWPCIGFDNHSAASALAGRILELGHRRIAMIAGITANNDRAAARVAGVREKLNSAGLPLTPETLIEAPYSLEAGAEAARVLLSATPRPTAILCGNDVLAAGALTAIRAAGLTVPNDVSLTGFDNIDLARVLDPPLTTVHVPHARMGRGAAEQLLAMCDGRPIEPSEPLQTNLIERESLTSPKDHG